MVGRGADLIRGGEAGEDAPPPPVEEVEALLRLRLLPGVGDRRLGAMLRMAPTRRAALRRILEGRFHLPAGARAALHSDAGAKEAAELRRRAERAGIRVIGVDEPGYPEVLHHLHDPPGVLFVRGDRRLLHAPKIAIVGSRRATTAGRRIAERLARELSSAGVTIVSGLAIGIDGAAHRGGLAGEGRTIAVLGRGPDRAYPLLNADLFHGIAGEGLLVSEFPPGVPARSHHFPRRNRILAALASAVVVVEAERRSGALLTVEHALDLGREVLAVPGSIEAPTSEGANRLIADGARPVIGVGDVLEAAGWGDGVPARSGAAAPAVGRGDMDQVGAAVPEPGDARLAGLLSRRPVQLELLLDRSGLPPSAALAALTRLELAGRARREPEGWIVG